jgi:hypothetical protein
VRRVDHAAGDFVKAEDRSSNTPFAGFLDPKTTERFKDL